MSSVRPKVSSRPYRWSSLYRCRSSSFSIRMPNRPTTSGARISMIQ
ncbi:Uncharacterised protein [Bordetella pertussis]|nr:Uncharacterised protein [Bordetella pertussis]